MQSQSLLEQAGQDYKTAAERKARQGADGRAASGDRAGNNWTGRAGENEHSYSSNINVGLGFDEHCQSLSVVVVSGSPHGSLASLTVHTTGRTPSESQTARDSMVRAGAIISLVCSLRIISKLAPLAMSRCPASPTANLRHCLSTEGWLGERGGRAMGARNEREQRGCGIESTNYRPCQL